MFRKTSVALAALLVASTAVIAPAAQAATKISNGVSCTKKGAITKVGADSYTCTTNPISIGTAATKLVWVSKDCLTANTTLSAANKQLEKYTTQLKSVIVMQVNAMILWSETKFYTKGDIVFLTGSTYYEALADSKGSKPSDSVGAKWMVHLPSAIDAKIGTMPDPNLVVLNKEKDVSDWAKTVTTLTADVTKLQSKTNLDTKTKQLITTMQNQINTLNIGIRLANNRIKSLQKSITMLSNNGATDASAILLRSNIDTADASRKMLCQKGL